MYLYVLARCDYLNLSVLVMIAMHKKTVYQVGKEKKTYIAIAIDQASTKSVCMFLTLSQLEHLFDFKNNNNNNNLQCQLVRESSHLRGKVVMTI